MNRVKGGGRMAPIQGGPTQPKLEVEKIGELVKQLCITRSNLILYSFDHSVSQKNLESN